jgi:hypothetical protein
MVFSYTVFLNNMFLRYRGVLIWSLNGTHWHLADIEALTLIQLITTYKLEFLFCKWMVQNTLIDIWITSQAAEAAMVFGLNFSWFSHQYVFKIHGRIQDFRLE